MKERPILFSGEMVRRILSDEKRQTRRLIKPEWWRCLDPEDAADRAKAVSMCPYGVVGDRLWVRETWAPMDTPDTTRPRRGLGSRANQMDGKVYRADECTGSPFLETTEWRPSIHMPRWASRITLEVTEVRVQSLQDISEEDALAEGVTKIRDACYVIKGYDYDLSGLCHTSAITPLQKLWDDLNGDRAPWDSNPWVWAITFKRVAP